MKIISNIIELHIYKIVQNEPQFLLLKRSEKEIYPGIWQMVSGKIRKGEKAYNAAKRELMEETGLIPISFDVVPIVNSFYSCNNDSVCMVPVFVCEVKSETEVKISDEHTDFQWVSPEIAKSLLAWDGQRRAVDVILNHFLKK